MAGKLNLIIEQGAEFERTWVYKDENDDPVDLTGYTAQMQIRLTQDEASPIYDSDDNNDITITALTGTLDLVIPTADTTTMTFDRALWSVELTITATGKVIRLLEGWVDLSKQVVK